VQLRYEIAAMVENEYVIMEITKGIYGLPQAGKLSDISSPVDECLEQETAMLLQHAKQSSRVALSVALDDGLKRASSRTSSNTRPIHYELQPSTAELALIYDVRQMSLISVAHKTSPDLVVLRESTLGWKAGRGVAYLRRKEYMQVLQNVRYSMDEFGLGDKILPRNAMNLARAATNPYLMEIDGWLFDGSYNSEIGPICNDPVDDTSCNTGNRVEMVKGKPRIVFYCKHLAGVNAKSEALMSYGDPYWQLPCNWIHLSNTQKSYLKEKSTFESSLVDYAEERWAFHKTELSPAEEELIRKFEVH
jgi:hypothetical protein